MSAPLAGTAAGLARRRPRLPALVHDTATTMGAEATVLIGGLLFYALAARYFDPAGVGLIALVKRASGLLLPAVFLGLPTGLPRCIAAARAGGADAGAYTAAGFGILAIAAALTALTILLLPGPVAAAIMGSSRLSYLALPLAIALVSVIVYGAVRGMYFGVLKIPLANAVQVAAVAVAPVVAIVIWHPAPGPVLIATGLATTLVAVAGALPLVWRRRPSGDQRSVAGAAIELLRYSTPRMPGDLAIAALMSAGTLWAARFSDLHAVGYLSISQSLLSAVTAAFIPLSVVILPRAAALVITGQTEQIRSRLRGLVRLTLVGSLFVTLQGIVFADVILYWWLGPRFAGGAAVLRCILAGIPFLALFFSLRGLVDAATATPYHTYNLFAALGVMAVGMGVSSLVLAVDQRPLGIAVSGSAALLVLAVLTVRVCARLYDVSLGIGGAGLALGVCATCAGVALLAHRWLPGTSGLDLVAILGLEAVLAAVAVLPSYASVLRQALAPGVQP